MFQKIYQSMPKHLVIGPPGISWTAFSSAVAVSVLGFTMWPHLFMKAYATNSEKTLKQTVAFYPTFAIIIVPVLFIGFAGIGVVPKESLKAADEILPTMIMTMKLSPITLGFFAAATLAAAMSSADTITHGAASVYTMDFHKKLFAPQLDDQKAVFVTRIAVLVFTSVAYYIAVFGAQSLVALLLGAYGSIIQFLPLVFATFFWPRATKQGALAGLLVGVSVNTYFQIFTKPLFDIHVGIWGLLANTVVFALVSYATPPQPPEHVDRFT